MKRRISLLLVLAMILSMVPVAFAAEEAQTLVSVTNESVTTAGYTANFTVETAGTITVVPGDCSPGWCYKVYGPGYESLRMTKNSLAGHSHAVTAGDWSVQFFAYGGSATGEVAGTVSFDVTFTPDEGEVEVQKAEYEVSETTLALGDNTLTLLDTAVTTIYTFEPTETAVYTFTAPEGAILGYWGAGSWYLSDPGSTTNTYEWTCTGVGQTAYIGVSGVEGEFNLNVEKTGEYTVVETPIVKYENKATLATWEKPEGATLGSYVDVYGDTHTAVLGDDGYYHLDSTDGDVLLVDMDYQEIILSAALKSDRPVMYAYMYDADGNVEYKYDIGDAVLAYEAVMDANGYYPVTEDIILFYQVYAMQAGTFTFHVSGDYNEECVWMYCMRTMNMDNVTTEPEETEPSTEATEPSTEATEPSTEATEPSTEATEPETEATEPSTEATEPETEATEPETEPSEPAASGTLISVTNEAVTTSGYVFEYTAATAGTLHVSVGECSPGWRYKVFSPDGVESGYRSKYTAGTECDYYNVAGNWKIVFYAYSSSEASNVEGTVSFTITFTPDETQTEVEKDPYAVSTTKLAVGSNTVSTIDTAEATIYKFTPSETGTYTVTGPEGSKIGIWGYSTSYLNDPNSTSNSFAWECANVGPSIFVGVLDAEGEIVLTVAHTPAETEATEPSTEATEPSTEATEPSVPETEATEPSEPETEPTVPSVPDEDVPAGTYYSITIDGTTTYYSSSAGATLNSNLKKITGTGYVKFYQDMELGSSYTVDVYNGDVTIDLNGCTITSAYKAAGALYVSSGNVTLVDTSAEADGEISSAATNGFGIEIYEGSVTMLSGNAKGYMGAKVWATATFNLKGGYVYGTTYAVNALANSTVNISGGTMEHAAGSMKYALYANSAATVTVTGGYFKGTISGSGLNGKISGGYFTASPNAGYIADGCTVEDNADTTYLYKVVDPNAVEPEPSEPETEPTEPETEPTEPETEPTEPETEPTEPETEPSEPVESGTILSVTNETVTASGYTFEYTAATAGTLTVIPGTCTPGYHYKVYGPDYESIYFTKWSSSHDHEITAGTWTIVFNAYTSSQGDVAGTVSFDVVFTPAEGGSGEVEKAEYEVSETELALGDNTLTLLDTAITTIFVFEPTETAVYTFTAPDGTILGYWGAGEWFLTDPNSTTNTYEWTCTGVGQCAYIGVSGVDGEFTLTVEKTGDYTVVETPIVKYENKATLETFTLPEGATLGGYVDVYGETHTAVLGEDGYYHLDSVDGPILLIDLDYMEIILSAALKSDRPVMYAYMYDADGNVEYKYDIGDAVLAYEAVMDENAYYPVTEDIILFYQVYAMQAGTFTFHLTGDYNEECVWMYCMRTMTLPEPEPAVELTHISLNPGKDALGYKAAATNLPEGAHVEISLWVNNNNVITKQTTTLRLINILKYNGGETVIYAQATIVDSEGNVIAESAVYQTTMRETLETVNANWSTYTQAQQDAVKALCNQYYDAVKGWELNNILDALKPEVTVEQIEVVDQTMTVYGGTSATFTLSGACTFAAQDTAETVAQNPYANWIADYYVSMDAQAQEGLYLAGNYGDYGWIAIPVAAGETYDQVALVSTMLNTTMTYTDVVEQVGTFSCGLADTQGNNAGATVTVELRLTNPEDATQYIVLNSTELSL